MTEITGTTGPGRVPLSESRVDAQGRGVDGGAQVCQDVQPPTGLPGPEAMGGVRHPSCLCLRQDSRSISQERKQQKHPQKGKPTSLSKKNN